MKKNVKDLSDLSTFDWIYKKDDVYKPRKYNSDNIIITNPEVLNKIKR